MNKGKNMLQRMIGAFILCVSVSGFFASANAQSLTTAGVNGLVTDTDGSVLIGATVVALHEPSGTTFGAVTREDGRYNLVNVRVGGPYKITVSYLGFNSQVTEGIYLELSKNLRLDFKLKETSIETGEVVVTADRSSVFNSDRTGASTNISARDLNALPTVSRSILDMARLTPQIAASGVDRQSGSSAAGKHNKYNNIQIDGAVLNDVFGLPASGTPGGQANAQPISMDAIQEFQVAIAPYDVRQGGFTGASINAVTRSGSNRLEGSAYTLIRNEALVGKSVITDKPLGDFTEKLYGFRLGGPILKDELFFFINGEISDKNEPNPQQLLARQSAYDSLVTRLNALGYDPGPFDFSDITKSVKLFGRLDWNIGTANRLTLRHNYITAKDDVMRRSTADFYLANSNYIFNSNQNSTVLQLNSVIDNKWANEFRVAYTTVRDFREYPGGKFPAVQIREGTQFMYAGTEANSTQNALDQDYMAITNDLTYFAGSLFGLPGDHAITLGTHNEFFNFSNLFIQNYWGLWEFPTIAAFYNNAPSRYRLSYSLLADPAPRAEWSAYQFGFYLQDEWTINSDLKVTGGVRVDVPYFPDKPLDNPKVDATTFFDVANPSSTKKYKTSELPNGKFLISPRVGFNWDVTGDKSLQVRGGTGLFAGRTPAVWLSNQYSNTGMDFARIDRNSGIAGQFTSDINNQPKNFAVATTSAINMTDPDFKLPQVWRNNIAVDTKLPLGFIGTFETIYSMNMNDVAFYNINIKSSGTNRFDGRPVYSGRVNAADFTQVILMKSTNDGYQLNLTPSVSKPFGEGILPEMSLLVAYNFTVSKDIHSATSSTAGSQIDFNRTDDPFNLKTTTSGYEVPHRFMVSVNYELELMEGFKSTFGLFYEGRSGRNYSLAFNGDFNGDGSNSNDLLYIPTEEELTTGLANAPFIMSTVQAEAFNAYIKKDDYMSKNRGKIMDRNGGNLPFSNKVDFKFIQEIALPSLPMLDRHRLEFTVDILNVGNLLNKEWGQTKTTTTEQPVGVSGANNPKPNFTFNSTTLTNPYTVVDLESRWYIQIGARYTF